MKQGIWLKKELAGAELYGKTLGILGMGRIGAEVARRAAAFGMTVLGYDPLIPAEEILRRGAQPVSLDDLYARSDYISLAPAAHSRDSLDARGEQAFARMKRGVRLICAARGGIIDESALLAALAVRPGGRRGLGCLCHRTAR